MSTNTKLAEALREAHRFLDDIPHAHMDGYRAKEVRLKLHEALAAHDAEQAAQAVPAGFVQVPMCSDHAVSHAVNQARSESHKQGDAAFQQAFARAIWRQFNAMLAAAPTPPAPEAQQAESVTVEMLKAGAAEWLKYGEHAAKYPLTQGFDSPGLCPWQRIEHSRATHVYRAMRAAALAATTVPPAMAQRREPLTRQQIDKVMTKHYPLDSMLSENVDAFEECVRDIEAAHGIGATTGEQR